MSKRISHILEVITATKNHYSGQSLESIRQARIAAEKHITSVHQLKTNTTIADKYGRQFRPHINKVHEFDSALHRYFSEGDMNLRDVLLFHAVNSDDKKAIHELFTKPSFLENPDVEPNVSPARIETSVNRIVRRVSIAESLKLVYDYRCQICGTRLEVSPAVFYCEVHHIKPLGTPHNGNDEEFNMLCVCPNHHVLLDRAGIIIDENKLLLKRHQLKANCVSHHNKRVIEKWPNQISQ
jgi:predicted restriction endonuclease